MSSLTELPEIVGFFSYSRDDDVDSKGNLSALRDRIQRELRGRLGRTRGTFRLWQDTAAIPQGALWEDEIKAAIAQSVFFIPIITPTTVRSPHCKREFELFLAREAELGRQNLIFPLLYIRVPELENELWRQDDVLKVIGSRQYMDWQERRYLDVNSTEVAVNVGRFCSNIYDALRQAPRSAQGSPPPAAVLTQPPARELPGYGDAEEPRPAIAAAADKGKEGNTRRGLSIGIQATLVALIGILGAAVFALWRQETPPVPPAPANQQTASRTASSASAPAASPVRDSPAASPIAPQPLPDVPQTTTASLEPDFVIRKSPAFGGNGGDPFDDSAANPGHLPISGLRVGVNLSPAKQSERIIGRLQVQWGNTFGAVHGGKGPFPQPTSPVQFAVDERINKIFIVHKEFTWLSNEIPPEWVAGLQIRTNKRSYIFGDPVGPADECVLSNGEYVIGFFGRSGSYIDQIGCIFAKAK